MKSLIKTIGILLIVVACIIYFLVIFSETDFIPEIILKSRWLISALGAGMIVFANLKYKKNISKK